MGERINDIATSMAAGSKIVFINMLDEEEFQIRMDEAGFGAPVSAAQIKAAAHIDGKGLQTWQVTDNVAIEHYYGDATEPPHLRPLMEARCFSTAIVLGTSAAVDLPPKSRDT